MAITKSQSIERAEAIINGMSEPRLTEQNYVVDMIRFMNYHNTVTSEKEKRAILARSLKASGQANLIPIFERAALWDVAQLAVLLRAKDRGDFLRQEHLDRIESMKAAVIAKYSVIKKVEKKVEAAPVKAVVIDRNAELAATLAGLLNEEIDNFMATNIDIREFPVADFLKKNQANAATAKLLADKFRRTAEETQLALDEKDEQLVEGYSNFKRVKLRFFAQFLKGLVEACEKHGAVVRVMKPRAVKVKPPAVVVRDLPYMKEFKELGLTSVSPTGLIGAQEAYFYDTETRKLIYLKAADKEGLGVSGTSVKGFDVAVSGSKILRKPEVFFKGLNTAKVAFRAAFTDLTSKVGPISGRSNKNMILVKVF